jgi:hypothetical protein
MSQPAIRRSAYHDYRVVTVVDGLDLAVRQGPDGYICRHRRQPEGR